jgi:hypothetical protein
MLLCVAVGLWALRRTHSTRDFFMAGRDLGVFVTALAVFSSTLSGFGFVGGPGLVYRMGTSSLWMVIPAGIGYACSFFLLAKRLRLFAELRDSVSLPDAVAARYGSESSRFLTALAILLGVIGYLATQILAMAHVLRDILAQRRHPHHGNASTSASSSPAPCSFSTASPAASSPPSTPTSSRAPSWWSPPSSSSSPPSTPSTAASPAPSPPSCVTTPKPSAPGARSA